MGTWRRYLLLAALLAVACGEDDAPDRVDAAPRVIDAGIRYDAAPGVTCRGADCLERPVCCRQPLEPGIPPAHYCVPELSDCGGVPYSCDGPEDCADGEQCCSTGDTVECLPAGTCPESIICHSAADCPAGPCCDTPFGVVKACYAGC